MISEVSLSQSGKRAVLRPVHLAGVVLALAITASVFIFRNQVHQWDSFGYLGIFLLSVVGNATVVLPAPAFLSVLAGGSLFNPVVVGVVAAAGATLGELTGYLAGMSGQGVVGHSRAFKKVERWMHRCGVVTLFVLAAIPNPLFDVAGITAGVMGLSVRRFLLVTWAGKVVKFLAIAYVGAGSADLLTRLFG